MVERTTLVGAALVAAGVAAVVLYYAALPTIHGFEVHCDAEYGAQRLTGGGWYAVRGPGLSRPSATYNASDGTTLIVPGCGHGDGGVALRVRGDHRGFNGVHDHLILEAHGVTGALAGNLSGWDDRGEPPRILDGTFETRSIWGHALLQGAGLVGVAAGVGLLRTSQPRAARVLPASAAAGAAFAHADLAADIGLMLFLFVAPVMGIVTLGALVGSATEWRRKWWFWAGALAFALAWWFTFTAFLGAYPLSPDA